jgi:hypothetical protein
MRVQFMILPFVRLPLLDSSRRILGFRLLLAILVAFVAHLPIARAPHAKFSRPFWEQLMGSPIGSGGAEDPFWALRAITVGSHDNWYVAYDANQFIDEFNSSNIFVSQLPAGPHITGLAFDGLTEHLYTSEGEGRVAVDNSTDAVADPMAGVHYITGGSGGSTTTVRAFNSSEEPVSFRGKNACINGNELTPACFGFNGVAEEHSIVVDGSGNIFVGGEEHVEAGKVDEFNWEGEPVREFKAEEITHELEKIGLPGQTGRFSYPEGVAVDSSSPGRDLVIADRGNEVVDEVVSSGPGVGEFLGQVSDVAPLEPVGPEFHYRPLGVAVNSAGVLYVTSEDYRRSNATGEKLGRHFVVGVFGPGAFYPDVVTGGVSGNREVGGGVGEGVLEGVVGDEGRKGEFLHVTDCHFEVVDAAGFKLGAVNPFVGGVSVPCEGPDAGEVPVAVGNHRVHARVGGLVSGVVYHYRLVATTNPAAPELGGTAYGGGASFAAAAAPRVDAVSVDDVSSSFADFRAEIDPLSVDTSYRFEYVSAAGFDGSAVDPYAGGGSVPVPEGDIGSGDSDVSLSVAAGGLSPGTVYHYRVVASNAVGMSVSGDGVFSTLPVGGQGPPDGRGYELVTPANKGSAEDMFGAGEGVNFDLGSASGDGNHFLLLTTAAFGPFPASGENSYVFSRSSTGWSESSVASPTLGVQSAWAEVYDPRDFSVLGVHDDVGVQFEDALGLVGPAGGSYTEMSSSSYEDETNLRGASADLSHVVVESKDHKLPLEESQAALAESLEKGSNALYEWTGGGLRLVDVTTEGSLVSKCGAVLGLSAGTVFQGSTHNAVSSDGSKILFTAPDPYASGASCWNEEATGSKTPQVYARVNGEETIKVSAPEEGVVETVAAKNPVQPALYVGASEDGSRVFFVTRSRLTKDAVESGTQGMELYEYHFEAAEGENWWEKRLVRISGGESRKVEGDVSDVPAISGDGSTVYFDASGELTAGHKGGLFRFDTVTGEMRYVAPSQGYPGETAGSSTWYKRVLGSGLDLALDVSANYYTTGDGRFLVFSSTENLAEIPGYKSEGHSELYRYDTEPAPGHKSIECVSCNPGGSSPNFSSEFTRSAVRENNPAGTAPRPISENGEFVFFDTAESLLPQDTNGKIDVYEWHEGVISLITSGQDSADSFFLDSGPYVNAAGKTVEGGNVFFGTHARLVPQDTDSAGDLYDARIGGGFKLSEESGQCEGDACQNPPAAPVDLSPASLTFTGPGNVMTIEKPKPKAKGKPKPKRKTKKVGKRRRAKHARRASHARHTATRGAGK